jgi:hypothetical protein
MDISARYTFQLKNFLNYFYFPDSRCREPPWDRQRVALPARYRPLSGDPADVVAPILSRISKIFAHHKTERTGS